MPPRPEDLAAHGGVPEVSVRLADTEPVLGLMAAITRFCLHLTPEAVDAMPEAAVDALGQVQSILWRLERRPVEPEPGSEGGG